MSEKLTAFKFEDDGWGDAIVRDMESLSGQSLEGFVDQQAVAGREGCINGADGTCQLAGEVRRWRENGMVETGMGGYTPGMIQYVSAEISCGTNNCPSSAPIKKLANLLSGVSHLAGDANKEIQTQTRPLMDGASKRAEAILSPVEAEAEQTILQPARERAKEVMDAAKAEAKTITDAAKTQAESYTKKAKDKAKRVRTAASEEAEAIHSTVLNRVLTEAGVNSGEEARLF